MEVYLIEDRAAIYKMKFFLPAFYTSLKVLNKLIQILENTMYGVLY